VLDVPSFVCSASLTVARPCPGVMDLFTPEGERAWAGADGWHPQFPEPKRTEGVGTVFTTRHGSHQTTWVMVDQTSRRIRYARILPGISAGTVEVVAVSDSDEATQLQVSYDLTALAPEEAPRLEAFAAAFESDIAAWETKIARYLSGA
jgi:hypothetical protein